MSFVLVSTESIFSSSESRKMDFFEYYNPLLDDSENLDKPLSKNEKALIEAKVENLINSQFKQRLSRTEKRQGFLKAIWFLYFHPSSPSKQQIAVKLGKKKSSISAYKVNFQSGLRKFNFSTREQLYCMEYLLRRTLSAFSA